MLEKGLDRTMLEESLDAIGDLLLDCMSRLCSSTLRSRLCSTTDGPRLIVKKRSVLQVPATHVHHTRTIHLPFKASWNSSMSPLLETDTPW